MTRPIFQEGKDHMLKGHLQTIPDALPAGGQTSAWYYTKYPEINHGT
jgi:hypothetical protein